MAGKKSGKIGRGLLWLAAVILLLVGILFFAFTALVYQGQLPFGYQITLVEQSGCDIPLTDTLVLTQQQEQYSSGDSVVFFVRKRIRPGLRHLTAAGRGMGVDQAGAGFANQAITGKILICFPTLGKLGSGSTDPPKVPCCFGWHRMGVVLLGFGAVDDIRFPRKKAPCPRSSQAAYQPERN